jgi:hypothetical protein
LKLSRCRVEYGLTESHGFCWKIFIGILSLALISSAN